MNLAKIYDLADPGCLVRVFCYGYGHTVGMISKKIAPSTTEGATIVIKSTDPNRPRCFDIPYQRLSRLVYFGIRHPDASLDAWTVYETHRDAYRHAARGVAPPAYTYEEMYDMLSSGGH
jgi:hypothetical protein